MRLQPFATAVHVEEALRLFQVSTLDAAMSGSLSGKSQFLIDQQGQVPTRLKGQGVRAGLVIPIQKS